MRFQNINELQLPFPLGALIVQWQDTSANLATLRGEINHPSDMKRFCHGARSLDNRVRTLKNKTKQKNALAWEQQKKLEKPGVQPWPLGSHARRERGAVARERGRDRAALALTQLECTPPPRVPALAPLRTDPGPATVRCHRQNRITIAGPIRQIFPSCSRSWPHRPRYERLQRKSGNLGKWNRIDSSQTGRCYRPESTNLCKPNQANRPLTTQIKSDTGWSSLNGWQAL